MGFLSWLFRPSATKPSAAAALSDPPAQPAPSAGALLTEKEIFESPTLLAAWVNKYVLTARPLENDYSLLPDEESRTSLNITFEQLECCVREYSVLRIAGISFFIKQYYSDEFWLAFNGAIVRHLSNYLYQDASPERLRDLGNALDIYVRYSVAKDVDSLSTAYMTRVYDDSNNYLKMKLGGIGYISSDLILGSYDIFRDTYCKVTKGMPYESFKLISEAIEQV